MKWTTTIAITLSLIVTSVAPGSAYGENAQNIENAAAAGPLLAEIMQVLEEDSVPGERLQELLDLGGVRLSKGMDLFVIVTFKDAYAAEGKNRLDESGLRCQHLKVLPMSGVALKAEDIGVLSSWPEVRSIYWDSPFRFFLDESADTVDVRPVWNALGEKGKNATVFVIDTGVDGTHPDLLYGKNLVQSVMPVNILRDVGVPADLPIEYLEDVALTDQVGHGTHCLGIVGGTGEASGGYAEAGTAEDPLWAGKYTGMAPECRLISYGTGAAALLFGWVFGGIMGFDYALEKQQEYGINVISCSWGDGGPFDPQNPVCAASLECYKKGILTVFAAGNGKTAGKMNPYSVAPWVMSVAAGTKDGGHADLSSQGTNIPYDHPDITAPGRGIMAAKSRFGQFQATGPLYEPDPTDPEALVDTTVYYQCMSGTSMATPHIAGIAALLFSANPKLSPDQVMDILTYTTSPVKDVQDGEIWKIGAGYVNASAAYLLALNTTGNLDEFKNGTMKYASGGTDLDPEYELDCVSVGYDYWPEEEKPVVQEISPKEEKSWLPGFGVAALLAGAAAVACMVSAKRKKRLR